MTLGRADLGRLTAADRADGRDHAGEVDVGVVANADGIAVTPAAGRRDRPSARVLRRPVCAR